jgi:hypothetical protein
VNERGGMTLAALPGWRAGCALPDRRPLPEWAREFVKLGGGYARQGAFDIRTCRHLEGPFAAVQDDGCREITLRAGIQTLKTLFVEITSLWAIANEPGPIMWTQQDEASAKEHTKGRYRQLLTACEPIARIMPRNRHDRTTTEIYFGDFYLLINGASINNLQSKSIRWKINSECWLWKQGLLTHARRRVSAYARDGISKILNESQGSYAGDDFDRLWQEGTQELWAVPCAGCGKLSALDFFARMADDDKVHAGLVWDQEARREDGTWDEERVRASARWRCAHCGHEHDNTAQTRARWNRGGAYLPGRPEADGRHRSFAWNSLIAEDLGQLAVEFLQAGEFKRRGQLQPLRDFYMQRLALPWKDEAEDLAQIQVVGLSDYTLAEMFEAGATKLDGEAGRFMTVDRQRDHFWVVVRVWKTDGDTLLLWRGKVLTTEQIVETAEHFGVEPQLVCEDAQYHTAEVYADCVRYGWTALHGSGDDGFAHVIAGNKVTRFYSPIKRAAVPGGQARYMFWASDPVKDVLASLRAGGGWQVPADVGDDYVRQLRGETKRERINKTTGRSEWRWVKVGPNHYLDCEAMQVAVALALQILPSPEPVKTKET